MIYTVFFNDGNELPQDFSTYSDALSYAEEVKSDYDVDYTIECTTGEIV